MKSYSSLRRGIAGSWVEFAALRRRIGGNIPADVSSVLASTRQMAALVEEKLGLKLENLRILEIGPGQQLLRLRCLAASNEVAALDSDVIVQGWETSAYWRMLRRNGAKRLVKTVLRKGMGMDRAYRRELEKRLGPSASRRLPVVEGDAHALPWPEESFDFVYSFSVFEHLRDPARCLAEVRRVLKIGGGFCIGTHLYTSDSGSHDPRMFTAPRSSPPYWAHLRPKHQSEVKPNAYCNQWRLSQWEEQFRRQCPGVLLELVPGKAPSESDLHLVRAQGELQEHGDRELLTVELRALWRKEASLLPQGIGAELLESRKGLVQRNDPALGS